MGVARKSIKGMLLEGVRSRHRLMLYVVFRQMRYPPYGPKKIKLLNRMVGDPSPQYPRNWKATPLPLWKRMMLLGARTKMAVVRRYLFAVLSNQLPKTPFGQNIH